MSSGSCCLPSSSQQQFFRNLRELHLSHAQISIRLDSWDTPDAAPSLQLFSVSLPTLPDSASQMVTTTAFRNSSLFLLQLDGTVLLCLVSFFLLQGPESVSWSHCADHTAQLIGFFPESESCSVHCPPSMSSCSTRFIHFPAGQPVLYQLCCIIS